MAQVENLQLKRIKNILQKHVIFSGGLVSIPEENYKKILAELSKPKCPTCQDTGIITIEICSGCGGKYRDCDCPAGSASRDIPCPDCQPEPTPVPASPPLPSETADKGVQAELTKEATKFLCKVSLYLELSLAAIKDDIDVPKPKLTELLDGLLKDIAEACKIINNLCYEIDRMAAENKKLKGKKDHTGKKVRSSE